MTRVLATGTFDLLHPGHVHYLESSAALGDELWVIVARASMVDHKSPPVLPDDQRREMVDALAAVDTAILGSEASIYEPLHDVEPDVLTLGHDQHFDADGLAARLSERGIDVSVVRIDERRPSVEEHLLSSSDIVRAVTRRSRHQSPTSGRGVSPVAASHTRTGGDVPDAPEPLEEATMSSILF